MGGPFVEVTWLAAQLDDQHVRIVDTRSTPHGAAVAMASATEQFAAGHIPGAVHLDYATDVHDLATPYAARVAPPERFAEVMAACGIGDDTFVVAYDEGTAPYAARMVWMLQYYGHDRAAILAGGVPAWANAGRPLTQARATYPRAAFTPKVRPQLRASREEALAVAEGRSRAQFVDTQRDGTYALRDRDYAGAVRISGDALLEDARGGRIAEPATLQRLVTAAGLDPHARTIVACGSGVGASGAFYALREAGFTDVAVYDGSWMEWAHDGLPSIAKDVRDT